MASIQGLAGQGNPLVSDLESFVAMLAKAGIGYSIQTKFEGDPGADEDDGCPPERSHPDAASRVTVYGGSGMHAEAEFDAQGSLLDLGRLEHY